MNETKIERVDCYKLQSVDSLFVSGWDLIMSLTLGYFFK